MNRSEPDLAFEGFEQQDELDINTNPPSEDEIAIAIKSMKSGKAAGINGIQAELESRTNINSRYHVQTILYNLDKG